MADVVGFAVEGRRGPIVSTVFPLAHSFHPASRFLRRRGRSDVAHADAGRRDAVVVIVADYGVEKARFVHFQPRPPRADSARRSPFSTAVAPMALWSNLLVWCEFHDRADVFVGHQCATRAVQSPLRDSPTGRPGSPVVVQRHIGSFQPKGEAISRVATRRIVMPTRILGHLLAMGAPPARIPQALS